MRVAFALSLRRGGLSRHTSAPVIKFAAYTPNTLEANKRYARLCHRSSARVNQHQLLVHALSGTSTTVSIRHQVESGAAFHANRDHRMDIVTEAGGPRDATYGISEYRNKAMLLGITHTGPQAGIYTQTSGADRGGSAASTFEARERSHHASPGQMSFDKRS